MNASLSIQTPMRQHHSTDMPLAGTTPRAIMETSTSSKPTRGRLSKEEIKFLRPSYDLCRTTCPFKHTDTDGGLNLIAITVNEHLLQDQRDNLFGPNGWELYEHLG